MITERPKLLIFDVNETLLDLTPLQKAVDRALRSDAAFEIWFPTLLHYSLVETLTDSYQDFSAIAKATLKMVSFKLKVELSEMEITTVLGNIRELPPHADVQEGLALLRKSGFKLVAFSNGNEEVLKEQLKFAEIDHFFDRVCSVEAVRQYKPKAASYRHVLQEMATAPGQTMLIAAHGWDIVGAQRAGLHTAFVEREGKSTYLLGESPDLIVRTVLEVAQKLTAF